MLQKGYGKNVTNMIEELKTRSGDLKHTAATCGQTVAVENLTVTKQTRALGGHNLTMALRSYELGSINNQQGRETLGTAQDTLKAVTALHAKVGTHAVLEDDRKRQTSEFAAVLEYASCKFTGDCLVVNDWILLTQMFIGRFEQASCKSTGGYEMIYDEENH